TDWRGKTTTIESSQTSAVEMVLRAHPRSVKQRVGDVFRALLRRPERRFRSWQVAWFEGMTQHVVYLGRLKGHLPAWWWGDSFSQIVPALWSGGFFQVLLGREEEFLTQLQGCRHSVGREKQLSDAM